MDELINKMYEDLLTMENVEDFLGVQSYDDGEEFMTSKELVKAEKESKEKFGVKSATKTNIEEEIHFKSYSKKRVHKYTDSELAEIRKSCEKSIVHDYGDNDIFHMSDEERSKNDMLAELGMKLGGLKRTYRKVDQYIEAMRIVVQAWKILENQANYLHDHDEFFTLVGEEKIVSNRIIMPKLKKMDNYNIDRIILYISNPDLDPRDLVDDSKGNGSSDSDDYFIEDREDYKMYYDEYINNLADKEEDDEEYTENYDTILKADQYAKDKIEEEEAMRLLSQEEAQYLLDNIDNPPSVDVKMIPRKYIKGYDTRSNIRMKKRKLSKKDKAICEDVHDLLNKLESNPSNRDIDDYNRSYLITHKMFDTDKEEKDFWDDLFFDGSWANKSDVFLYDFATRQKLLTLHPPKDRYLTYADKELNEFFKIAEKNGINVIELRRRMEISEDGVLSNAEAKEKIKENKKLEAKIMDRISKFNKDPKFKKLVKKSEEALNKYYDKE